MAKKKEQSFEKKLTRLEEISRILEDEESGLEDSIKLFEEGIMLSKDCLKLLKNAELKIVELRDQINGFNEGDL